MNAQRKTARGTRNALRGSPSEPPPASQPNPSADDPRAEPRDGSGQRRRVKAPPPLDATTPAKEDPELEQRVFMLVTKLQEEDGFALPADMKWIAAADAAKRRGYIEEKGLKLFLREMGKQWLETRAEPNARGYEFTKISKADRFLLKQLARETGVPMQEAIGHIMRAIHHHRDELTKIARRAGYDHPWEGIEVLARGK
jgi:hypothetical protein